MVDGQPAVPWPDYRHAITTARVPEDALVVPSASGSRPVLVAADGEYLGFLEPLTAVFVPRGRAAR